MKHIYIVEDDKGILESLTFLLEKTYRVTALSDARIALNRLATEQPDLILLDYLMPDLNGKAFLEAFSQLTLSIPILVMSAYSNVNAQLTHSSIVGHIRKPFQIEEMVNTIERTLAG